MQSKATTVEQYLAELSEDRRAAVQAVREVILKNLDPLYREGMQYGMIGYAVPHSVFPDGYHCDPKQPLPFAGLASQKNHMSVYLMTVYGEGSHWNWFRTEWAKTGKKLDMGKCCIRFKRVEDLALDLIGKAIRDAPTKKYIAWYERMRDMSRGESRGLHAKVSAAAKKKAASAGKGSAGASAKKVVKKGAKKTGKKSGK